MSILEGLNEVQLEAVQTVRGPLLILAGAGSGKTRVLTRRIAFLVAEKGVDVDRILAMTFTNKAAGEMRERVEDLLERSCRGMWIGTFHSLCARILRSEAEAVGLGPNFTIYDTTDQMALLRRVIRDQEIPDRQFPPRQVRARISREKNRMVDVTTFSSRASTYYEQEVARVYRQYQEALKQNNAVDFDDLLVLTVRLLQDHEEVLQQYRQRFDYLLIDEYQDTNRPQYLFARLLAEEHQNLCVVGDDDQSIYAWRGADLRNILDFEQDYPDATVIRLEQNYRSTGVILAAGNSVIQNNFSRKGKELWTDRAEGESIRLKRCQNEAEEARWIAGAVQDLKQSGRGGYRDMAVLYRTNAQSRALEDGMRRAGIPYDIVGDVRFYERKEVKDILAYLRLVVNPRDSVSFARIINTPRRGIGDTSVSRLDEFAMREGIGPYDALNRLDEIQEIPARTRKAMGAFFHQVEAFRSEQLRAEVLAHRIVSETGYLEGVDKLPPGEAESRRNHVQELLTDIQIFTEQSEDVSLEAYLRNVSLVTDVDRWAGDADRVSLMTLHSAKGLEFPYVFIGGMEDGLFPILHSDPDEVREEEALEEERRLFYVGITRAQERLFLSHASQRRRYGGFASNPISRFVGEITEGLLDAEFRISEAAPAEKKKSRRPVSIPTGDAFPMEKGTWVYHPAWGRGQIQSRSGTGPNTKLSICFEGTMVKTIMVKFAHLSPG